MHAENKSGVRGSTLVLGGTFAAVLLLAALLHHSAAAEARQSTVQARLQQLTTELQELRQAQAMPGLVLERHRDSIGFLYGLYSFRGQGAAQSRRVYRVAGTGFVVAEGVIATNRHIAEPWFDDPEAEALIRGGAQPRLEKLVVFFPSLPDPIELSGIEVSPTVDLAVARFAASALPRPLMPLPLARTPAQPGTAVTVVGYPMGLTTMLAKSPAPLDRRVNLRHDDLGTASELAAQALIRPSATSGHLGDVVGDKLIYDAPTARGASGGPVFNARGEVIGVNAAYLEGFAGGTLGVSVEALRVLLRPAAEPSPGNAPVSVIP